MAEKRHIPGLANLKAASLGATKRKNVMVAVLAVCLVVFVALAGTALAKYMQQFKPDGSAKAQEFYFTSEFLDGETHKLAPGSERVTFTLGNHADDLRYSAVDISYTVTVARGDGATVDPKVEQGAGTLTKGSVQNGTVTISGLKSGTYTITAVGEGKGDKGEKGYKETLTATIEVLSTEGHLYQHVENVPDGYAILTVWNEGDTAQDVFIEYTGIPDNTNPNMGGWQTATTSAASYSVTIQPHESKIFRFFDGGGVDVKYADSNGTASDKSVARKVPK